MIDHRNCDIEIRSLQGLPFRKVAEAFINAFSDYAITLDEQSLAALLKRRGARPDLSFAAFADDRIVSFIINGVGSYNGQTTAYDTGTGTIKEFRGLGLTDRIFTTAAAALVNAGVRSYLLEVLTDNEPAVRIYTRQGFSKVRDFDCFTADNSQAIATLSGKNMPDLIITHSSVENIASLSGFMDFVPSWQNSFSSILRNPEAFLCLTAYDGDTPIGFGVSETAYGDISLLAVDRNRRRQGIGSAILLRLLEQNRCQRAKALNIDNRCREMTLFLEASGFELSCRQYEMIKHLL